MQLLDRGLAKERSGSVAIEAALILPILFGMSFAVIEVGRGMWMQNSLQQAVDAAARCGAVSASCTTPAQIQSYAAAQINGFPVTSSNFTAQTKACGLLVSASVPFTSKVIGMNVISINLTADSCRPS